MPGAAAVAPVLVVAAALWGAGLSLFLQSRMTTRRKIAWSCFLVLIGLCVGVVLPLRDIWNKFLWMMAVLPLIAAADVFVFRSTRGLTYWIRACGFEVGTVFALAAAVRYALDVVGAR